MTDIKNMKTPELSRLRKQIETDPQYRAPLAGHTPEAKELLQRIQDEIERRVSSDR